MLYVYIYVYVLRALKCVRKCTRLDLGICCAILSSILKFGNKYIFLLDYTTYICALHTLHEMKFTFKYVYSVYTVCVYSAGVPRITNTERFIQLIRIE